MSIDFSAYYPEFISNNELRKEADNFRTKNWGDEIPVDVELIAEKLGINLIPESDVKKLTGSEAFLGCELDQIIFDKDAVENRLKFSIAHELGHFVMHRKIISGLRPNEFEEWKQIILDLPGDLWASVEYQANEFAGRLLVPRDSLITEVKKMSSKINKARQHINEDVGILNEYLAPAISKKFIVADQTLKIRLEKEQINAFKIV